MVSPTGQTLFYLCVVVTGAHIIVYRYMETSTFSLLPPCVLYTMWPSGHTQIEMHEPGQRD